MRPYETARVKVCTRSMNERLYERAMSLVTVPFPKQRLVGTTADGYLYQVIADTSADYVINIDEDAFVTSNERLLDLLDHVIENGYGNAGMPDGGVISHRVWNPLVTNPCFTIMNTKLLRGVMDLAAIEAMDVDDPALEASVPRELMRLPWEMHAGYEPFYRLSIWMSQTVKTLYLDAREHRDGISTEILDHLGRPVVLHTWYSREYGRDFEHTDRINAIADEAHALSGEGHATTRREWARLRASATEYKIARRVHIWLKRRYGL